MNIEVYTFEDANGDPFNETWSTQDIEEARRYAKEHQLKIIARIYEYADSEVVEDHTPKKRRAKRRGKNP